MKKFVWTIALTLMWPLAFAHTHLKSTIPADGSVLQAAPKNITLKFEGEVQLTAVSLTGKEGKEQPLAKLPAGMAKEAVVSLPTLAAGQYVVKWRAAGHDGHVVSGQLKFTVEAPAAK